MPKEPMEGSLIRKSTGSLPEDESSADKVQRTRSFLLRLREMKETGDDSPLILKSQESGQSTPSSLSSKSDKATPLRSGKAADRLLGSPSKIDKGTFFELDETQDLIADFSWKRNRRTTVRPIIRYERDQGLVYVTIPLDASESQVESV
mmetsp:Transcript_38304/g.58389  ORF Transcript_38304/g.58389 Transcript_38304/m.58389 type:complete len:149 (-) Transcript_38304:1111-1557(-)